MQDLDKTSILLHLHGFGWRQGQLVPPDRVGHPREKTLVLGLLQVMTGTAIRAAD
ncbi:hypothetical protein KSC_017150 [Ktedonobacter sp. SOSP1-52]|nr:hypothetical protein KSC_017150 [Ktedonobacter sp. SOSP1-52]